VPVDAPVAETGPLTPEQVWLDREGNLRLSPGVVPGVGDLGALLELLLLDSRPADASASEDAGGRIPRGLVLLTARATRHIDVEPFASPADFATALERFEPANPNATLRGLFAAADDEQDHRRVFVAAAQPQPTIAPALPKSIQDYEYQAPLDDARARTERQQQRERVGSRPRRRTVVALAIASAVAGVVTAVVLPWPRGEAARARETNDVQIVPPSAITMAPDPVRPRISPPSANPSAANQPRVSPSAPGSRPGATESSPSGAASHDAPRLPTGVASDRAATREPQPLVARDEVDADAIFSPSFSADGAAFFFQAESTAGSALKRAERGERGVLHVVTIADDAAKNYHVKLSPDGKSVAFDSDRDGIRGVYVAHADGTGVRRVSGAGYAAVPTWSPDGRRLAFLRAEEDRPRVWNLWLLELDTGEMARLTSHRYGQVWAGAWFPDGRRIAYSHEDRLILLELDSGRSASYASPLPGRLVRTPAVSPDGGWIMFQVFRDGGWLLDLGSGSMQRVLDDPSAEEFTWAPDGRRVAFHSRRAGGWGLWMMAAR
jgi:hypothetical protein